MAESETEDIRTFGRIDLFGSSLPGVPNIVLSSNW